MCKKEFDTLDSGLALNGRSKLFQEINGGNLKDNVWNKQNDETDIILISSEIEVLFEGKETGVGDVNAGLGRRGCR